MKLVTAAQMRALEQAAVEAGGSLEALMDAAGLAVAQEAWMQLGQLEGRRIAVLVGPGNNGGDGLVAARHLADWGAQVRCYALAPRDDPQWTRTAEAGIPCGSVADDDADLEALRALVDSAELIIDALLGAGTSRPIAGTLARMLEALAAARAQRAAPRLIAVDLPTGIDPDSGLADPHTVAPDETVTFAYPKVGLYTQPGAGLAGDVQTVDIGIPKELAGDLTVELVERRDAKALLPERPPQSHKGTFGRVLVVAGSAAYPGAAILAASAAYRTGAGLVTLATPASLIPALVPAMPEVTYLPLDGAGDLAAIEAALPPCDALLIGPGLGQADGSVALVRALLRSPAVRGLRGMVVDADGLNALAGSDWSADLPANVVVTPHPGEMARLTARDVAAVQGGRLAIAQESAAAWGATVVLKGANTVVASPEGATRVSAIAHAALATAGTGDVLAGALAGLLAQGLPPLDAATLAVYLQGNAGERAARSMGSAGATAGDVLRELALAGRSLAGEEPIEARSGGLPFGGGGMGAGDPAAAFGAGGAGAAGGLAGLGLPDAPMPGTGMPGGGPPMPGLPPLPQ